MYVDFAHALLRLRDEGRHKLLSFQKACKVAEQCGFEFKFTKCTFCADEIVLWGFVINADGSHVWAFSQKGADGM